MVQQQLRVMRPGPAAQLADPNVQDAEIIQNQIELARNKSTLEEMLTSLNEKELVIEGQMEGKRTIKKVLWKRN